MGQKVNPNGIRLGINRTWSSRWFSSSEYSKLLHQDLEIKQFVEKKLKNASNMFEQEKKSTNFWKRRAEEHGYSSPEANLKNFCN